MKKDISVKPISKKCFIYARTATIKKPSNSNSIDYQIATCVDYANKNNLRVVDIYKEEGLSGVTLNRTRFLEMIRRCELHDVDAIIVTSFDRITRNTNDYFILKEKLERLNVKVYLTTQTTNVESPETILVHSVINALFEYEVKYGSIRELQKF